MGTARGLLLVGGVLLLVGLVAALAANHLQARVMGQAALGMAVLAPEKGSPEWKEREATHRMAERLFWVGLLLTAGGVALQSAGSLVTLPSERGVAMRGRLVIVVATLVVVGFMIAHFLRLFRVPVISCADLVAGESIALGLVVALFIGCWVEAAQGVVRVNVPPPSGVSDYQWEQIRGLRGDDHGGWLLGHLERILIFGALWTKFQFVIAGWLTYKLASQWHTWRHVVKLGDVPQEPISVVGTEIRARLAWGSHLLSRFLIGSLYSLVAAVVGFGVGRAFLKIGQNIMCSP